MWLRNATRNGNQKPAERLHAHLRLDAGLLQGGLQHRSQQVVSEGVLQATALGLQSAPWKLTPIIVRKAPGIASCMQHDSSNLYSPTLVFEAT